MSAECACGHPDLAHWDASPGTELRPCGATLPGPEERLLNGELVPGGWAEARLAAVLALCDEFRAGDYTRPLIEQVRAAAAGDDRATEVTVLGVVGETHYCPCIEFRPRTPAPLWMRAVNRVLGRLG
jgi:hypothetical protein